MKKHLLIVSCIICAGLAALVLCAAGDASASGTVFTSADDAAEAMGNTDVQVEVLQTRLCTNAKHGKGCYVQEIIGRIVCAGKNAGAFHAGECVGIRATVTPCGTCQECKAGRATACRNAGWVCAENCNLHRNACRNRIVTAQDNVVRLPDRENTEQKFTHLCSEARHCPELRCHRVSDDSAAHSSGHHRRRCSGLGRHCR